MSRLVYYILTIAIGLKLFICYSQEQSVARLWNEVILEAIRNDFARPTVHARNLFHLSAGMYDAWAVFDDKSETYFLNKTNHGYKISYQKTYYPGDKEKNREIAISYAAFRILNHRYEVSPGYKNPKESLIKHFQH